MTSEESTSAPTAGALLRKAREAQGLHLDAVAAALKVASAKLEALEEDRLADLPDPTFARALAQAVCRHLKADPAPVLAAMPSSKVSALSHLNEGLNAPFRERPRSREPLDLTWVSNPMIWASAFVIAAAAVVYFVPTSMWRDLRAFTIAAAPAPEATTGRPATPAARGASEPTSGRAAGPAASSPVSETVFGVSNDKADGVAGFDFSAPHLALITVTEASWIEAVDAANQVQVSRIVQPGETVGLDGTLPLKLKVGNAAATRIVLRGEPFDFKAFTRDNVARIDLK